MKFTNYSDGPRGVQTVGGNVVMIDKGQSADLDVSDGDAKAAKASGWFTKPQADEIEDEKPLEPVSLSGKTKAELLEIAAAEGVTVADDATNAQITDAITAKRSADAA